MPFTAVPPTLEFIVPDGRHAVLMRDGELENLYLPGRHQVPAAERIEVRLTKLQPHLNSIPFETSLHYLDGELVEIVRNGGRDE